MSRQFSHLICAFSYIFVNKYMISDTFHMRRVLPPVSVLFQVALLVLCHCLSSTFLVSSTISRTMGIVATWFPPHLFHLTNSGCFLGLRLIIETLFNALLIQSISSLHIAVCHPHGSML
jgi:hypothetical protein